MGVSPAGCGSDCSGAPLLAPLYVACNLGFNIAALNLLRAAGVRASGAKSKHWLSVSGVGYLTCRVSMQARGMPCNLVRYHASGRLC